MSCTSLCVRGCVPQLEAKVCGKGVGKHVMQLMTLGAMKRKMQFVMVTVFRSQDRVMRFFLDGLKFAVDETSPSRCDFTSDGPDLT